MTTKNITDRQTAVNDTPQKALKIEQNERPTKNRQG